MYRNDTVAVVVPAHDEAAFVDGVVAAIPAFVDRIYVVDDASSDGTATTALDAADPDQAAIENTSRRSTDDSSGESSGGSSGESRGESSDDSSDGSSRKSRDESTFDPDRTTSQQLGDRVIETTARGRVVVLRHDENRGPGGAVVTGYIAALADGADLIATIDGDGQMEPRLLARFLDPLVDGDADYATGTRLRRHEHSRGMPAFRLLGNGILTLLCRISSGYRTLTDPVNGYTAITREALEALDPASGYEGYGYGIELLARLHADDRRVADVPVPSRYGDEVSGIDYRRYVTRVSRLLVETLAWRLSRERVGPDLGRFRDALARPGTRLERRWEP